MTRVLAEKKPKPTQIEKYFGGVSKLVFNCLCVQEQCQKFVRNGIKR